MKKLKLQIPHLPTTKLFPPLLKKKKKKKKKRKKKKKKQIKTTKQNKTKQNAKQMTNFAKELLHLHKALQLSLNAMLDTHISK